MTRDELVETLRARDALAAAPAAVRAVSVVRGTDPHEWFRDGDEEGSVDAHREAHSSGRPSVATVRYGETVDIEDTADRLLALGALATETGLLRAVELVPADGVATPGSWGVEDLTVVAAARRVLDPSVRVRPSWRRLGPQTCGVALAFGADELVVPDGDTTDLAGLVAATGRDLAA